MPHHRWATCQTIEAAEARFDKVTLFLSGHLTLEDGVHFHDLPDRLIGGQIVTGGASSSTVAWNRYTITGPLKLTAPNGWPEKFASTELRILEPTASAPHYASLRCHTSLNPSRMREHTPRTSIAEWFLGAVAAPIIVRERIRGMPVVPALNPGARDAAEAVSAVSNAVSMSIFGPDGAFDRSSISYAECYWHFSDPSPTAALDRLSHHLRSQGRFRDTLRHDITEQDENGVRVLHVELTQNIKLAFYPRGDCIRAEVRYLRRIANAVPGAGKGTWEERFALLANDAARRLNRVLASTMGFRNSDAQASPSPMRELCAHVATVWGNRGGADEVIAGLLHERGLAAGPGNSVSLADAMRLTRLNVLSRAPVRARDRRGRRFTLHPRFAHLPWGSFY